MTAAFQESCGGEGMGATGEAVSPRVAEIFEKVEQLASTERLTLAKLLLESVLTAESEEETDWTAMSLSTFRKDWNNAEDAIYDNCVPTR